MVSIPFDGLPLQRLTSSPRQWLKKGSDIADYMFIISLMLCLRYSGKCFLWLARVDYVGALAYGSNRDESCRIHAHQPATATTSATYHISHSENALNQSGQADEYLYESHFARLVISLIHSYDSYASLPLVSAQRICLRNNRNFQLQFPKVTIPTWTNFDSLSIITTLLTYLLSQTLHLSTLAATTTTTRPRYPTSTLQTVMGRIMMVVLTRVMKQREGG